MYWCFWASHWRSPKRQCAILLIWINVFTSTASVVVMSAALQLELWRNWRRNTQVWSPTTNLWHSVTGRFAEHILNPASFLLRPPSADLYPVHQRSQAVPITSTLQNPPHQKPNTDRKRGRLTPLGLCAGSRTHPVTCLKVKNKSVDLIGQKIVPCRSTLYKRADWCWSPSCFLPVLCRLSVVLDFWDGSGGGILIWKRVEGGTYDRYLAQSSGLVAWSSRSLVWGFGSPVNRRSDDAVIHCRMVWSFDRANESQHSNLNI